MGHLQVRGVESVIANEAQAVGTKRDRSVLPHVSFEDIAGRGGASSVVAMGHLQTVDGIPVADDAEAVGADCDRAVSALAAVTVECIGGRIGASGVVAVGHL